jgi:hypothetical protein
VVESLRRLVVLAVVSVSAPAGLGCAPEPFFNSFNLEGKERFLTGEVPEAMRKAALAEQASRDLGCPAAAVRVEERAPTEVYAVEACGKRALYLAVACAGIAIATPGFEGTRVRLRMTRFVLLSEGDGRSAVASLRRAADAYGPSAGSYGASAGSGTCEDGFCYEIPEQAAFARTPEDVSRAVGNWIALSVQGARDLACPRAEVVVGFRRGGHSLTPTAEGCGKRAVYLSGSAPPFDLASIVPLGRP